MCYTCRDKKKAPPHSVLSHSLALAFLVASAVTAHISVLQVLSHHLGAGMRARASPNSISAGHTLITQYLSQHIGSQQPYQTL